ncbi:hypothetical protein BJF79_21185 [Actinomadura sp. CNU-125]|nr:hypothetical protein BJF79_21185 [Actinomadura sp. CNU-125]
MLSAVAIAGMFYVLTWSSAMLAAACATVTAVALPAAATLLAPVGLPAFTLPFCLITLVFLLAGSAGSRLLPVKVEQATTPERHRERLSVGESGNRA